MKESATKWYTTLLRLANRQKSCYKVRIYTDKKLTFLKGAWHLTLWTRRGPKTDPQRLITKPQVIEYRKLYRAKKIFFFKYIRGCPSPETGSLTQSKTVGNGFVCIQLLAKIYIFQITFLFYQKN